MDFELSARQKNIQWTATEFAQGEFNPDLVLELERNKQFPESIWKKACQLGFIGVSFPKEFGGLGLGLLEHVLVIEAFCRVDSGIGIAIGSVGMGTELILKFGEERQKKGYLFPVTKGTGISSLVPPEINGPLENGSSGIPAKRKGDRYVLKGQAEYVLNGSLANFFIVYCRINSEEAERCLFVVVERDTKGLSIIEASDKLGMAMLTWNKLIFNDVEVSKENVLGDNDGLDQLSEIRKVTMVKAGALALGIAQGAFDRALAYAKQREQFGKKIGAFQGIRHKLADMYVKIQAAKLLIYSNAAQYDRKKIELRDTATANLLAQMTAVDVTDEALQIFGGAGYMIETPIEHFYRDARIMRTITGQQLLQKDVIADSIISMMA
jgi:alkylation response protein AidB-like acyl-CoA dehydrogenase